MVEKVVSNSWLNFCERLGSWAVPSPLAACPVALRLGFLGGKKPQNDGQRANGKWQRVCHLIIDPSSIIFFWISWLCLATLWLVMFFWKQFFWFNGFLGHPRSLCLGPWKSKALVVVLWLSSEGGGWHVYCWSSEFQLFVANRSSLDVWFGSSEDMVRI